MAVTPNFSIPLYTGTDTAKLSTLLNGQATAIDTNLKTAVDAIPKFYRVGLDSGRTSPVGWTPAEGVMYYSTDTDILWRHNGTVWTWMPRNIARLSVTANQAIGTSLVAVTGMSQALTLPAAGRVRITLTCHTFSGSTNDVIQLNFRDGTTVLFQATDGTNSATTTGNTSRTRTLIFDWDAASGAHTINLAAVVVVGASATIAGSASSPSILSIDWLG